MPITEAGHAMRNEILMQANRLSLCSVPYRVCVFRSIVNTDSV